MEGTTYLHTMASFGKTDDCRTLLQLGANPNKPCRAFEAGDGWGELEFGQFTPLHFAASNGKRNIDCFYSFVPCYDER